MGEPEHIASVLADLSGDVACRHCGSRSLREVPGPHRAGHYARADCSECGRFVRWLPKPQEGKRRRKGQAALLRRYSNEHCELCMRKSGDLPLPQVLEAHHVVEVKDGGTDERENVWVVCTHCHRLIHHFRTYMGHYRNSAA